MSVFSLIKRSRQQAKEHNQQRADKAKSEAPKQPYRHVPTHAAVDALSGAPSSWKHEDRSRILEQNRRRSAMAASGMNMRMPGPSLPRVTSSLSHVTYPSVHANPAGRMPRAYSYSGVPPPITWQERSKELSIYSAPDTTRISLKGKEVERSYDSGRNSPSSIKAGSPVGSSSQSSSSQEDLEMKPSRHQSMPPLPVGSPEALRNPTVAGHAHRLHPSSRRASDASDRGEGSPKGLQPSSPTDRSKPPPSMRSYNSIPPMPSLPPMQFGNSLAGQQPAQPVAPSSASTTSRRSSAQASFSSFNFNIGNAPFSAPISGKSSAATTPAACVTPEPVYESVEEEEEASSYTYAPAPTTAVPSALKQKDRKSSSKSKVARFCELETINSHSEQVNAVPSAPYESARRDTTPPQVSNDAINKAIAVEMVTAAPSEVVSPKSAKRLSKLTKKNRWSTKSSAVAV